MLYGPYKNGDLVQLMTATGMAGGGILFGIVHQSGTKTFKVLWESDHVTRYSQDYYLDRAWFGRGMEQFEIEITDKLTKSLEKRNGQSA